MHYCLQTTFMMETIQIIQAHKMYMWNSARCFHSLIWHFPRAVPAKFSFSTGTA